MCYKIILFIKQFLPKNGWVKKKGFRFSVQHCLFGILVLFTDLSKAFDCLPHELIMGKLNVYGFSMSVFEVISNYLTNCKQRIKINNSYSFWEYILFEVPEGSILDPILFNILLSDLFLISSCHFITARFYLESFSLCNNCHTL